MIDVFIPYPKTPRLFREVVVTEKIDGTNAIISIDDAGQIRAGSRSRWITPDADNYGFAAWVRDNQSELFKLGPGRHFGEWWGPGIQRRYNISERRFSLFNVARWADGAVKPPVFSKGKQISGGEPLPPRPACCHVVPTLWRGVFNTADVETTLLNLRVHGSVAAPGFMHPEGVIAFHSASGQVFKVLLENDTKPKGE